MDDKDIQDKKKRRGTSKQQMPLSFFSSFCSQLTQVGRVSFMCCVSEEDESEKAGFMPSIKTTVFPGVVHGNEMN